ncbi:alpha/beta hydrolase family protein, partial [Methanolacinia paynteri]|uniref:alpha/beta hydrolase family protein n=1 Tax=Methanolacinia paynteri TaxID=230356 RepID=UPI00064FB11A
AIETTPDGKKIVYDFNSASNPPQLYSAEVSGSTILYEEQLTDLNPEIISEFGGSSEVIHWTGALGDQIEGIVRYPPGYMEGQDYPFVFVIHGGPTYTDFDSWRDTWEFPYCMISEMGAVLLSVNYHGSLNYGFDFAESIENGHYYDLPVEDLISGKEYLDEQGIINLSQTASTGWSNGGILTLALITKDTSLKAAIAGAGTAEDQAQNANTNGMIMTKMYYGESPYQDPEMFLDILPIYNAANVTTPLLMMIGTEDANVEPASAITTYRTYLEGSSAPVRFLMFPGEKHHPTTYVHQYRKVREELDWLDKYLFSSS